MNNATMMGRIGKDAELRYTSDGTAVTSVNIAVDRYKKGDQKQDPLWVKCTFWGKKAEGLAEYLKKGTMACVAGPIDLQTWEDKEGGQHSQLVLNVREFSFGGGSKKDAAESNEVPAGQHPDSVDDIAEPKKAAAVVADDDIPF